MAVSRDATARVLRQQQLLVSAAREKPPPRPPDKKRRPAPVVRTSNRPLVEGIFKTNASQNNRNNHQTEAARRAAEALFTSGSSP